MNASPGQPRGTVLVVEDDPDISALVEEILTDEGFVVSLLRAVGPDTIRAAVAQLEPDCILLDGESPLGYGASWTEAAWIANRDRTVPVIMLTGSVDAVREATQDTSVRSQAAGFAGVLTKPFELSDLLEAVQQAMEKSTATDER